MTKVKTTQVSFTITNVLLDKIDEMIADEGTFLSRSDLVRAAIAEFYDAHRPKYIYEKSPKQKEQRQQLIEEKKFESMSNEEYAQSIGAIVLTDRQGLRYAALLNFGKRPTAVKLDTIKKWKGTEQFDITLEEHERLLAEGVSLEEQLKTDWSKREFDITYNIDLDNQ